jgi:hypothetical protein
MACELAQHGSSVLLVDDQKTVEQFASDEAFGNRVRPWRARRCLDDLDVMAANTASKAAVNSRSRSRIRNGSVGWRRAPVHPTSQPAPARVWSGAGQVRGGGSGSRRYCDGVVGGRRRRHRAHDARMTSAVAVPAL